MTLLFDCEKLLLDDLQQIHRAGLGADAAGDALGGGVAEGHHLHGTDFDALAAGGAELFVNHVNAGFGVLGDGVVGTGAGALAALYAGLDLRLAVVVHDADAALVLVKHLVEGFGTRSHTGQTRHTGYALLDGYLFHGVHLHIYCNIIIHIFTGFVNDKL